MNWPLIALRNITRNKTRVLSTVLIVAVGLAALLLGLGFMLATYDALQEIAKRVEGHVVITNDQPLPKTGSHQRLTLTNWQDIADELWDDERIVRVLPRARFEGVISYQQNSTVFSGTGVDAKDEFKVYGPFLKTDGALDPWLSSGDLPEVMLGSSLAKTLHVERDDVLTLHVLDRGQAFQAIKVRMAGSYHSGATEIDDRTLMVSLDTVQQLFATESISQLAIYLDDAQQAADLKKTLLTQLNGVSIQTWQQRAELYDKVKAQYDRIFSVMGVIIVVVVFLAISNTIALAIHQRREEIATLKALGTLPVRLYANFLLEALIIGVIATGVGMLLAYLCANAINISQFMMPAPPGRSEGYPIFVYVSWPHYFNTSLILIGVTAVASMSAAYRASKVQISKVL